MFTKLKKLFSRENGNVLAFASISMLGMLAITGLVMDGGSLYMTKSHLQKTANAAALSGAQELPFGETAVRRVVNEVLEFHNEKENLANIAVLGESNVRVHLKKEVPLAFSSIFGITTTPIDVSASAGTGVTGAAYGAAPLGIDTKFELEFYKEYALKTDTTDSDTGWFGILALGGKGAATYYENFKNGYQHEIIVGDILDTQSGNIAGDTKKAVQERIDNCPYTQEIGIEKRCSRIVRVLVYEPYVVEAGKVKQVKVKGFAHFYLTKPVSSTDTSVHGIFIKLTGQGTINGLATNRGAYTIRLTE